MQKLSRVAGLAVLVLGAGLVFAHLLHGRSIAVLNPRGPVAGKELGLMVTVTLLMLIVVIPVFVMTFAIAWRYRAGNTKAAYTPDWDRHRVAETVWWGIPLVLIGVISVITWTSSHELDPSRPLVSATPPITIQVVALRWKWLFIYPEQNIATVNYFQFPAGTPVNFVITSDAPMNSFWIPQLGGQIYAMAGMTTRLSLMADKPGIFNGSSVNLSGKGYAGMSFKAAASTQADFDAWVHIVKQSPQQLSYLQYSQLALPSEDNPAAYYSASDNNLYDGIVMKYMSSTPVTP